MSGGNQVYVIEFVYLYNTTFQLLRQLIMHVYSHWLILFGTISLVELSDAVDVGTLLSPSWLDSGSSVSSSVALLESSLF